MNPGHPSSGLALELDSEVSDAIDKNRPVVALESTVISHGLPSPKNLETAGRMLQAVRDNGAVPAIIAMIRGRFHAGLNKQQIEGLDSEGVRKLSVRDLPIAFARKLDGATTVATTSIVARAAGIPVFATGGIGGVHRGFSADVSADLPVLAETPLTVVCSGAKAVLDLPATREWLETNGVAVLGFRCDELPAFYSRNSGLEVDQRVESFSEAADIIEARDAINSRKAVLVAVPVPAEDEIGWEEMEEWIEQAVAEAGRTGVTGKLVTPFLLSRLSQLSEGRTLRSNISLLVNNAAVAARLAFHLAERRTG
jgi:pseudouridine-5'-phosphate glycosidase